MIIAKTAIPAAYLKIPDRFFSYAGEIDEGLISFEDVGHLLNANSFEDMVKFAVKYMSPSSGNISDSAKSVPKTKMYAKSREEELFYLARGYEIARRFMCTAIDLKELLSRKSITADDLSDRNIKIHDLSDSEIAHANIIKNASKGIKKSDLAKTQPYFAKTIEEDAFAASCPRFSLTFHVEDNDNAYLDHLMSGLECAGCFKYERNCNELSFDAIGRRLPVSNEGFHEAVKTALDSIFRINLVDVATVTDGGIILHECRSVLSSLWFELAKSFEGGRATRCKACERPMVAIGERGKKRLYCSQACSKWAQRHPGETRSSWRR